MTAEPDYRVYFFLPLPEALSVPEQPYVLDLEAPMVGAGLVRHKNSHSTQRSPGSISIVPRHVWVNETELIESSSSVLDMMQDCVPWAMHKANPFVRVVSQVRRRLTPNPKTLQTIIEVSAIMPAGWRPYSATTEDEFDPELEYVLDGAAEAVNQLHDLDYTYTKRAKSAVSPKSWPVLIHFAVGVYVHGEMQSAPEGSLGIFHNLAAMEAHNLRRRHDSDDLISPELIDLAARTPFEKVLQLMRESDALLHIAGSSRAALVLIAATCESLLDMTLMFLHWESGQLPEVSAAKFKYPRTSLQRVKSEFSSLLGGSWDVTKVPELRRWIECVVHPRNQVLHFGLRVDRSAASDAWEAFQDLRHFIANRLWRKIDLFQLTNITYLQALGMMPPGDEMDKLSDEKLVDLSLLDVWTFERWIHCLQALTSDRGRPRPSMEAGGLVAVVSMTGTHAWVWHDWSVGMACHTEAPADLESELAMRIARHPVTGNASAYAFETDARPRQAGDWVEEHCLIPGLHVLIDGSDFVL